MNLQWKLKFSRVKREVILELTRSVRSSTTMSLGCKEKTIDQEKIVWPPMEQTTTTTMQHKKIE